MKYTRVVVTGSLAYDHIMSIPTTFEKQMSPQETDLFSVSYYMKQFDREFGGTAGNITYNLSLLGTKSLIVATAGKDILRYISHLKNQKNIDVSGIKVYKREMSANGFVMTDDDQNKIWGFYEGAMKKATNLSLKSSVTKDDLLIVSANTPLAMVKYVNFAIDNNIDFVFDPAYTIPHIPSSDLKTACEKAKILFGNEYEIASLLERLGWNLRTLLDIGNIVVTTQSSKGSSIAYQHKVIKINPVKTVEDDIETTGVGDAYRAGFVTGILHDLALKECGQLGSLAATYALKQTGSQTHSFSMATFCKEYEKLYKTKCPLS